MSHLRHPLLAGLLTSVALTLILAGQRLGWTLPVLGDWVEALERRTADMRFVLRGQVEPGDEVVILAFDDKTQAEDPSLFERRSGWVRVLDAIRKAEARVVGIDAFFIDPEHLLPADLAEDIRAYLGSPAGSGEDPATRLLRLIHGLTRGDEQLAQAIQLLDNVVLALHVGAGSPDPVEDPALRKGRYGQTVPGPRTPAGHSAYKASLPRFNRAARGLGFITVLEDDTHTVREMPMLRMYRGGHYLPLAVSVVARYLGLNRGRLTYLGTDHSVHIGDRALGLNERDAFYLNFRGPAGTFRHHPVVDLVQGRLSAEMLRDRIVLLGYTHLGHDNARIPFGDIYPAVELHATAIDNILRGDPLSRSPGWLDALIRFLLGVAVALWFWPGLKLSPLWQTLGSLTVLVVYLVVSGLMFARYNLWLFWVGPVANSVMVSLVCLGVSYWGEGVQRRKLRHAFGHYLSDNVIQNLLAEPGALSLGGERRELTALFTDIRGFTNLSERIQPEELVFMLNTYFTPMTRAVLAQGGFLDKYIGDALMAVFGAPVFDPHHPDQALTCAMRMHQELSRLRPVLEEHGLHIDIGVGINTGEMVVGNMGSEERFDYTVVGDAVNLASRLEGLTKNYGVFCLAGGRTRELASEAYILREIDRVQVKGKSQSSPVHELVGGPGYEIAAYQELHLFEEAMQAFWNGDFPGARERLQGFARHNPEDEVTRRYLQRLDELGDKPPDDWAGVTVFLTK